MVKAKEGSVIPTSFQLAGCEWRVIETEGFYDQGMTYAEEHLIRVRKELSNQAKQLTFYHELVHAILFSMGETNHDEKYVDAFGAYLHQFEKTRQ